MNIKEKTDYSKKVYEAASTNDAYELEDLLKEEPDNDEFEDSLARVCMELQVNRVLLTEQTKLILYRKLLNLRFFHKHKINHDSKDISDRIEFTIKLILNLKESEKNDELFVLNLTFIAKQIFTLKKLLRSTYDRVPWEELEFCILSFIKSFQEQNKFIIFTRAILNKTKIVKYLQILQIQLEELRNETSTKLTKLPNLRRDDIIKEIIGKYPIYKSLYDDHERLRDISSLNFILKYVKLVKTIDPYKKQGRLILIRAFQVIGEHLKNTLESPKLSENTLKFLYLSLSQNSRKILIDIRDKLFHNLSCTTKEKTFGSLGPDILTGIKQDVEKIGEKIDFILLRSEIEIIKEVGYKLVDTKDVEDMKETASVMKSVQFKCLLTETSKSKNDDITILKGLISRLSHNIPPKHNSILGICKEIEEILDVNPVIKHVTFSNVLCSIYSLFEEINMVIQNSYGKMMMIHIEALKYTMKQVLNNLPCVEKAYDLKSIITKLFQEIMPLALSDKVTNILFEIDYVLAFQINDVTWIERFKRKLKKSDHEVATDSQEKEYKLSISELLTELKKIWSDITYSEYKSNEKLQAMTEALLLDLIPMMKKSRSFLYFFDCNCPSLIWIDLRNHLAHNNVIIEVLEDFIMATFLFVEKLLKVGEILEDFNMKEINSHSSRKVIQKYETCINYLNKKERMFTAIKKNNLEMLNESIQEGADIRSRDIELSTCLHFAMTIVENLELIEFLWRKGLSSRHKNIKGQSALHIAALTGDSKNINFLLKKFTVETNDVDFLGRTAGHLASLNGHVSVIESLLKHGADMTRIDMLKHSTLYYAIASGKIEVVEFFFKTKLFHKIDACIRGRTALHITAFLGSSQMLKFLLDKGMDVNARTDTGATPLLLATQIGDIELVQTLIRYGANVQLSNSDGLCPLHFVCQEDQETLLKLLLNNGADVNITELRNGFAPIHFAAENGHIKMVNILLENNANINISTRKGFTPLHLSVKNQHLEVVNFLTLQEEIEVNCTDKDGMTPLHYAAFNGNSKIIAILIESGAKVDCLNIEDFNSLHLGSQNGHEAAADLLIAKNISLKQKTKKAGFVPLHSSVLSGNENIIKKLIEAGSDINATTTDGLNCLHLAAFHGKDIIDLLFREGVEINAKTRNGGYTPLHLAVSENNFHIVKQLVKVGCNINAQDFSGNTPIHLAVESKVAEFLMKNGAGVMIFNTNKETAFEFMVKHNWIELVKKSLSSDRIKKEIILKSLQIAIVSGNTKMIHALLKRDDHMDLSTPDKDGNSLLHLASLCGKVENVKMLLNYGVSVNLKNYSGESPLLAAAFKGHDEIVEMLLEKGADINSQLRSGRTALHVACTQNHTKIVKILLDQGADDNKLDKNQMLAVETAVISGSIQSLALFLSTNRKILENKSRHKGFTLLHMASYSGYKEVVHFLLEEGADMNAENEDGFLPIHLAVFGGFPEIIDIFLEQGISVDFIDENKQSLLHHATASGKFEVVKYLVKRGCNVNSENVNKETPIIAALKTEQKKIVAFLLCNGAIINFSQDLQKIDANKEIKEIFSLVTNLFSFIEAGMTEEIEKIIKKDVPLNFLDSKRGSPLHFAAWKGNVEAVKTLLLNNARVNITHTNGWTPLHYAVKFSHVKIVFLLLWHGARFDVESNEGKRPISYAKNHTIHNILRKIHESFEKINRKDKSLINTLKKIKCEDTMKAIVRAKNHYEITLVTSAIKNEFPEIVQLKGIFLGKSLMQLQQGEHLFNQAKYPEAKQLFENIYAEKKKTLGEDNPITLEIQSCIVKVLLNQCLYEEAIILQEEIYEKLVVQFGLDHERTLKERVMIANLKFNQAKYEESFEIYQEVERIQVQIFPSYHEDLLFTRKQMALTLLNIGSLELALEILESVVQNEKMNLHTSDHNILETKKYIAMVLSKRGKIDEALQLFQKVQEGKEKIFGSRHPDTLNIRNLIIEAYYKQCKYFEALQLVDKLLNDQKNHLGSLHVDTLKTQAQKAHILYAQHKYFAAYKLLKESRHCLVTVVGSQFPVISMIDKTMKTIEKDYYEFHGIQSNVHSFIEELVFSMNNAAKRGDLNSIKKLTRSGMSVNEKDKEGFNSLHYAVNGNNTDILKYLLEHGGDITETTEKNNSLLHLACNKGNQEITQFILNSVDGQKLSELVNIATKTGKKTALHVAAERGFYEIVCLLLMKGAIFDCMDKDSKRPIDLTRDKRTKKILILIEDIFDAFHKRDFNMINNLNTLDNDEFLCVTNARNSRNLTIFRLSISYCTREITERILEMMKTTNAVQSR